MKRNVKTYCKALYQAVNLELSRKKSYGCVSYYSAGSHTDMDYQTIFLSIQSIISDFESTNWDLINNFEALRNLGIRIEKNMFEKTGGINTYKGLIFLQCFLTYTWMKNITWEDSPQFIKNLALPLQNDYSNIIKAKNYKTSQIADIRRLPLSGFKKIFNLVDDLMENKIDNDILSIILISMIDDTTTIKRSSLQRLRELQTMAKSILALWEQKKVQKTELFSSKLNQIYLNENISSGGVADVFTTIKTLEILRRNNDY